MNDTDLSSVMVPREASVGPVDLHRARLLFERCKNGKQNHDNRVAEADRWYRLRYDPYADGKRPEDEALKPFRTASAWLFNTIANKHADAMDNYPRPNILPRERGDIPEAERLSFIIPAILEQQGFEKTYSDVMWDKLKGGTGVYGVFWDGKADGGLGEVSIRKIDILSIFWDPGVEDIQQSNNVFLSTTRDREAMAAQYPALADSSVGSYDAMSKRDYLTEDDPRRDTKVEVVDWYYKKWQGECCVLHLCQFCGSVILYASENDPALRDCGIYDHGKFPFVLDPLYPQKHSPTGLGIVDICKNPQTYIDLLDAAILENAIQGSKPRYFVPVAAGVNEDEYLDMSRQIVGYNPTGDLIVPIETKPLDGIYVNVLQNKVTEMKETSGNRDATQGGTTSGVTAASAIAAMIETGSKLSRDSAKSSFRAFREVVALIVELIRQFYTLPHTFRITGEAAHGRSQPDFIEYQNTGLVTTETIHPETGEHDARKPLFDIEITAERSSPYSRMAQNELMLQLYGAGFFSPGGTDAALAAIDGMAFDQKEAVRRRIEQNGTLFDVNRQLMATNEALAAALGRTDVGAAVVEQNAASEAVMQSITASAAPLGQTPNLSPESEPAHMTKTRARVADSTSPT